ncbi:MAG: formate dehydrogenase accessory protein FdhE [Planctomycetota bacterium]
MPGRGLSAEAALKALEKRAEVVLKARPAYAEMVSFYLTVFRSQIEWRDKLVVRPQALDAENRRQCLGRGAPFAECHDPGIESTSLLSLWNVMKEVFREGNEVLRQAVERIDTAEHASEFVPTAWLAEQRPDCYESIAQTADRIGIENSVLGSLSRAVTFPHWELVAKSWLQDSHLSGWRRFRCPTCGGPPGLVESYKEQDGGDGISGSRRRFMHCPFCGSRWPVPGLQCPACGSTKEGDAKYLFSPDERELRIDFCKNCHRYVKVVDGDRVAGRIHVGLEQVASAHLDMIAREKELLPLEGGLVF